MSWITAPISGHLKQSAASKPTPVALLALYARAMTAERGEGGEGGHSCLASRGNSLRVGNRGGGGRGAGRSGSAANPARQRLLVRRLPAAYGHLYEGRRSEAAEAATAVAGAAATVAAAHNERLSWAPVLSRTLAGARGPPSRATDPGNIMQAHTLTQVGRRKRARAPFVAPSSRAGREQVETANRTESSQGGSRAGNSSTSSGPGGSWLHCTLWGDALRPAVRDRLIRTLRRT